MGKKEMVRCLGDGYQLRDGWLPAKPGPSQSETQGHKYTTSGFPPPTGIRGWVGAPGVGEHGGQSPDLRGGGHRGDPPETVPGLQLQSARRGCECNADSFAKFYVQ